jgi:Kef-type K+ transport system membrane component KefB
MDPQSALPLVLITVGAVAMPGVARKIGIPLAVAEIAFGLGIGRTGLGLAEGTPFITFLADVGFAFFMFLAGLEIDFRGVGGHSLRQTRGRVVQSAVAMALAFLVGAALGWSPWVSLAVGSTSVGLLVTVLREGGLNGTRLGSDLLTQGAVGETLTIVVLSVAHLHHETHGGIEMVFGVLRLLGLALTAIAVVVVLRSLVWWYPDDFRRLVAHDDPAELGVRVGFGLMFAFVGLSLLAGVEPFLGSFIAGAMLAYVIRDKGALEHKIASMAYGFFVPVFFIYVGMRMDLSVGLLVTEAPTVFTIALTMLVVKVLPTLWMVRDGYQLREAFGGGALLAAPLTLVIAIVDIGVRAGAVDEVRASEVIVGGIAGSLLNTSIARRLLRRSAKAEESVGVDGGGVGSALRR